MIRNLPSIVRDDSGASIIEMGLMLPILASLLIGFVDISRAYSAKLQLEQSAYRAIENVQQYNTTSSTYDTLKTEAAAAANSSGFSGVADTDVAVDFWLECNGTKQADYNTQCTGGQVYARWVTVDVTAKFWPMFASTHWPGANSDGSYTLHGKAGLRTQ
jgi:Flp pilus assembly protein TadG